MTLYYNKYHDIRISTYLDVKNTSLANQNNLLQRYWQSFLKVKPNNFLNVSLCHRDHIIADLRERATDLLYSIVKYCLDVVADAKAQTDLISGLKEKVEDI